LMIASRDPMANKSLIWFTVWSSFVHGAIMAVQFIADIRHIRHLWGDVPALIIVGAVLAALMPRRVTVASSLSVPWLHSSIFAKRNAIRYAKFYSRSHDAVIRVYDEAGNVIETHEHKGDFRGKEALVGNLDRPRRSVSARRAEQSELRHLSPPRPSR